MMLDTPHAVRQAAPTLRTIASERRRAIRAMFPALGSSTSFLDNAGGSQLPSCVIDAVTRYMRESFVQTGGVYDRSLAAAATVRRAHDVVRALVNGASEAGLSRGSVIGGSDGGAGEHLGEVVLGASTTALMHLLANAHADARDELGASAFDGRDEIVVCTAGHEANVWPWIRLGNRGFKVRLWHAERGADGNHRPLLSTLESLLSRRTLIVAFPQVSNILGEVWDPTPVCRAARGSGARVVVDGVAFTPHRLPDVGAYGCDWYVYSCYKVFGPHMAAVFGTRDAWSGLTGPNHGFISRENMPYKFELGGVCHEGAAAVASLWDYLRAVDDIAIDPRAVGGIEAGVVSDARDRAHRAGACDEPIDRSIMNRAFETFEAIENPLTESILGGLRSIPGVRIVGPAEMTADRLGIVGFTHERVRSEAIARACAARDVGIKHGNFYSPRLLETMGIDTVDGVARVSIAHYNDESDVERFLDAASRAVRAG
jgi:selenocysteine lyase/cysteine desulfurase